MRFTRHAVFLTTTVLGCAASSESADHGIADGPAPAPAPVTAEAPPSPVVAPPVSTAPPMPSPDEPTIAVRVLHREHRAIPGKMFGGWGPHLGHLLRRRVSDKDTLFFVDDACAPGACNVDINQRVDYLRLESTGWKRIDTQALPSGVQQNTASILSGDRALSYGIDSAGQTLHECARNLETGAKGCTAVPVAIGAAANYVGAAITPNGYRMAWLTNVKDGGGGSFSFFADYGGGWNGPRQGAVGGYNDASYVNVAFGVDGDPDRFTMHSELVSGLAPAWSFVGGVGEGSTTVAAPVTWTTSLVPPAGDAVISPDDVLVDARTSDTHLLARTKAGAAAYYFRPKGGAYQGPVEVFPRSYRARLVSLADGSLVLVRNDDTAGGLVLHVAKPTFAAGTPVKWSAAKVIRPTLPDGYESIYAIYTESSSYSLAARGSVEIAVVGSVRENEVLHISVDGLSR